MWLGFLGLHLLAVKWPLICTSFLRYFCCYFIITKLFLTHSCCACFYQTYVRFDNHTRDCHLFLDCSNCSHRSFETAVPPINPNIYTDHCEPIIIYHSITLLLVIQLSNPWCWYLDSNFCHTRCRQSWPRFVLSPLLSHLHLLGMLQANILFFTLTWAAKHSPKLGWVSTPRLYLYPRGGVFYPACNEHEVGGTSVLGFFLRTMESHENNSRDPDWKAWQV